MTSRKSHLQIPKIQTSIAPLNTIVEGHLEGGWPAKDVLGGESGLNLILGSVDIRLSHGCWRENVQRRWISNRYTGFTEICYCRRMFILQESVLILQYKTCMKKYKLLTYQRWLWLWAGEGRRQRSWWLIWDQTPTVNSRWDNRCFICRMVLN